MNTPNSTSPTLFTAAESGLCLPDFRILDLYLLTQAPTTLAPFCQTYFQDAGFLEPIHLPPGFPSNFKSHIIPARPVVLIPILNTKCG